MIDENMLIAQRIRAARLQRELTQQDLAEKFGKTSAAISDIERGKTQISATDLIKFSDYLLKPIEYFYGEDYGGDDVADIVAMLRKTPPELRKNQLPMMTMMLRMNEINYEMQDSSDPETQKAATEEFYDSFLAYYNVMAEMMGQLSEAKEKLESVMK